MARYMSPLFYVGPIYHLAFTKLDKINPQGQRQSDYDRALLELIASR